MTKKNIGLSIENWRKKIRISRSITWNSCNKKMKTNFISFFLAVVIDSTSTPFSWTPNKQTNNRKFLIDKESEFFNFVLLFTDFMKRLLMFLMMIQHNTLETFFFRSQNKNDACIQWFFFWFCFLYLQLLHQHHHDHFQYTQNWMVRTKKTAHKKFGYRIRNKQMLIMMVEK